MSDLEVCIVGWFVRFGFVTVFGARKWVDLGIVRTLELYDVALLCVFCLLEFPWLVWGCFWIWDGC